MNYLKSLSTQIREIERENNNKKQVWISVEQHVVKGLNFAPALAKIKPCRWEDAALSKSEIFFFCPTQTPTKELKMK